MSIFGKIMSALGLGSPRLLVGLRLLEEHIGRHASARCAQFGFVSGRSTHADRLATIAQVSFVRYQAAIAAYLRSPAAQRFAMDGWQIARADRDEITRRRLEFAQPGTERLSILRADEALERGQRFQQQGRLRRRTQCRRGRCNAPVAQGPNRSQQCARFRCAAGFAPEFPYRRPLGSRREQPVRQIPFGPLRLQRVLGELREGHDARRDPERASRIALYPPPGGANRGLALRAWHDQSRARVQAIENRGRKSLAVQ